jgi:hypothetical protein
MESKDFLQFHGSGAAAPRVVAANLRKQSLTVPQWDDAAVMDWLTITAASGAKAIVSTCGERFWFPGTGAGVTCRIGTLLGHFPASR